MKNAYIITNKELVAILGEHLAKRGYNVERLTVRFTATNAVVAGIYELGESSDPEDFDDEDEDEGADWDASVQEGINSGARELLEKEPHTVGQLAVALGTSPHAAATAIESLGAVRVAPAREDGQTVSKWMCSGTPAYDAFVVTEKARVDERVEELEPSVLSYVPKFHERAVDRPSIVNSICEGIASEDDREGIRRDAKAVFYRMAELGKLEHIESAWRAGKTEADAANVTSLQGAVREVLMASDEGLSRQTIAEKLPGFVNDSLLRHAIKRMDDVYEQGGLLFHSK